MCIMNAMDRIYRNQSLKCICNIYLFWVPIKNYGVEAKILPKFSKIFILCPCMRWIRILTRVCPDSSENPQVDYDT